MIVQFKFRNFKSFKDETILDMTPVNGLKELEQNVHTIESEYINIKESKNRLLKVVAINGQNASGKSNLIQAIEFFRHKVISFDEVMAENNDEELKKIMQNRKVESFLFVEEDQSSDFEITFVEKGIKYRYGFELNKEEILKEWLYLSDKGVEKKFFERKNNKLEMNNKKNIDEDFIKILEKTLPVKKDMLALQLIYKTFGVKGYNDTLKIVYNYIFVKITIIEKVHHNFLNILAKNIKSNNEFTLKIYKNIKLFIKSIDARVKDIIPFEDTEENYPFYAVHETKLRNDKIIRKNMPFINESEGTKKLFCISLWLLICLRYKGGVLIVDELDNKVHTNLFLEIIKLFQKSESQFIFATHNPYIMEHDLLRRDQIYFVDKNEYEESELYSLSDFQGVKTTDSYQKRYLNGNYGAVPIVDFSELEKSLFRDKKNKDEIRDDE